MYRNNTIFGIFVEPFRIFLINFQIRLIWKMNSEEKKCYSSFFYTYSIRLYIVLEHGRFELVTNVSHTLAEVCIKCSHIFQMIRMILEIQKYHFRTGLEFVILENCYPRILPCYICSILTTGLILIIEFGKFTWNFI